MIHNLRMGRKTCVAMYYIDALFERVETITDTKYKFNHTHQQKGESLSEYITQEDRMLHYYTIVLTRGIDPKDADQARLDQVLRGARPNHPIVLKFLLKRTKAVPTYPELIRKV